MTPMGAKESNSAPNRLPDGSLDPAYVKPAASPAPPKLSDYYGGVTPTPGPCRKCHTAGNRRPDNTHYIDLAPGEYCLHDWTNPPMWVIRDPAGKIGSLGSGHCVTVHEDESITVTPSILDPTTGGWHGWLTRGQWQES